MRVFKKAFLYTIYIGKNNKTFNFWMANENSDVGFMGVEINGGFKLGLQAFNTFFVLNPEPVNSYLIFSMLQHTGSCTKDEDISKGTVAKQGNEGQNN